MNEISLHILDILQNSIKAGATLIIISLKLTGTMLTVTVADNGCGMSPEFLSRVTSPFVTTRTTRKVGLGISLFKAGAEASGGSFSIDSEVGKGTTVEAVFDTANIDCPPLGDMTGTVTAQVVCNPALDFVYSFTTEKGSMNFDTREIKEALGEAPIDSPEVIAWMRDSIKEEINEIGGGNIQ